jgi:5-methylcytosine-specific restriction endonuclease McrA
MQTVAKQFYNSKQWKDVRSIYIDSVHGLCERCSKDNQIVPGLIVHHKIRLTAKNIKDPNISLNTNNFELLCIDCHNQEHMGKKEIRDYVFDDDGQLISKYTPLV